MEREELDRLIAEIKAKAEADVEADYEPQADDGLVIARALLQVLGRRLGLGFVLETQAEVLAHAKHWSESEDPLRRADAVEIAEVANAGYFTDLIDELADKLPSGRA
jgi:hypothetical protein